VEKIVKYKYAQKFNKKLILAHIKRRRR